MTTEILSNDGSSNRDQNSGFYDHEIMYFRLLFYIDYELRSNNYVTRWEFTGVLGLREMVLH